MIDGEHVHDGVPARGTGGALGVAAVQVPQRHLLFQYSSFTSFVSFVCPFMKMSNAPNHAIIWSRGMHAISC